VQIEKWPGLQTKKATSSGWINSSKKKEFRFWKASPLSFEVPLNR
jgi:hypothetical protein